MEYTTKGLSTKTPIAFEVWHLYLVLERIICPPLQHNDASNKWRSNNGGTVIGTAVNCTRAPVDETGSGVGSRWHVLMNVQQTLHSNYTTFPLRIARVHRSAGSPELGSSS